MFAHRFIKVKPTDVVIQHRRGLIAILSALVALCGCGLPAASPDSAPQDPLASVAAQQFSEPTATSTVSPTEAPTIQVGGLVLPDPWHVSPELLDVADPRSAIPQFLGAMRMAGIELTGEQVAQGLEYDAVRGRSGEEFVVGLYHLDPDAARQGETLEGPVPLLIARRVSGRWHWTRCYLRDLAEPLGVTLRVLSGFGSEPDQEALRETALSNFSALTISYDWPALEPRAGAYDPEWPDYQYLAARGRVSSFTLHHLLPSHGYLLPDWVDRSMTPQEAQELIERHIVWLIGHYREMTGGSLDGWVLVVVNEAMLPGIRGFRDVFADRLGPEYVDFAFEVARREAPDAILIYNDSNNHGSQWISTQDGLTTELTLDIAQRLSAKGLIDGIGLEMHLAEGRLPYMQDVQRTIDAYRALGVSVYVTEFDVILTNVPGSRTSRLLYQAEVTRQVIGGLLEAEVTDIGVWDLTDEGAWGHLPNSEPTLFDTRGSPKPNYYAFLAVLARAVLALR